MYTMGVDIGSASSKVVIIENGIRIIAKSVIPVGTGTTGPRRALEDAYSISGLKESDIISTIATGYGRMSFKGSDNQISEISCHARGVLFYLPDAKTIIDIGGQDAKVIKVGPNGTLANFVMNDKCAAGTGRFLEVMAKVLEVDVNDLAALAEKSINPVSISSTCTVFAESEVISQLASDVSRADVAAGVHQSVSRRVAGLASRIGLEPQIVMTGGVAKNSGVVKEISKEIEMPVMICPDSQITGALGAALIAYQNAFKKTYSDMQKLNLQNQGNNINSKDCVYSPA